MNSFEILCNADVLRTETSKIITLSKNPNLFKRVHVLIHGVDSRTCMSRAYYPSIYYKVGGLFDLDAFPTPPNTNYTVKGSFYTEGATLRLTDLSIGTNVPQITVIVIGFNSF